ncbi:transcriptional regulator [Rhodovarius crocodyli]|uniref:Transcriptional regulator n=1 Tax=Rhodovarius crocodyli TaxID=1979269 RepID=A0A437M2E2_9PROT|nr:IclR family transcriptional regulator C-terminal domain-containing protein [Rhodovarius crocodyli]RVT91725.1 transcriptional regulator [Rhodovarius crocodyli]
MSTETIKTARRVFEVLEYFDAVERPLTLKEIAGKFGYPPSSGAAVLKSMVQLGYLDYDRYTRTYMPTMRVHGLGGWVKNSMFGSNIMAFVDYVVANTGETVSVGTQSDLYLQYIHTVPSPRAVGVNIRPGSIRPLARSGLGWLILSARSDEDIAELVRRINSEATTAAERAELASLMAIIGKIREAGYVISQHTVREGAGVIGILIPERRHGRLLAIGVSGPVTRLTENKDAIVQMLRHGLEKFFPHEMGEVHLNELY